MSRCFIAYVNVGIGVLLIGKSLAFDAPPAAQGRLIRRIDATAVPKAGSLAKRENKLWRIQSAFDLPSERFGFFELTDEKGGERLDRIPRGEIRIGDRAYLQTCRIGEVIDAGADIVVRAGWRNARWLGSNGKPIDLLTVLRKGTNQFERQPPPAAKLAWRRPISQPNPPPNDADIVFGTLSATKELLVGVVGLDFPFPRLGRTFSAGRIFVVRILCAWLLHVLAL